MPAARSSAHRHTDPSDVSLTLVVPLYDEADRFATFAPELAAFITRWAPGSELLFVDDGSTDGTAQLVDELIDEVDAPIRLIRCPHRGKGAAVSAGLSAALTEVAAFCDLDLSTPLDEVARLVDAALRAPILAVASRGATTSSLQRRQHAVRELLGRAYNRAVQMTLVPGVVDTQCGAKAASTTIWQKVLPLCREQGFAWDVEAIAVARSLGIAVQEIGVEWHHVDGSKVHVLRDGARMLAAIPRIRRQLAATRRAPVASAQGPGTFNDATAALLAENDGSHWWFRSKASLVAQCIRRHGQQSGWLVDIGAGSGGVSTLLGWDPERTLVVDGNVDLVRASRSRHALVPLTAEAAGLPVRSRTAACVCLLDVIEHLNDPVPALREAARAASPDGCVIVNVPAHEWLWSAADVELGHQRRYTRRSLRRDLHAAGLEVVWMSHVFSWLVPAVWVKRRLSSRDQSQLGLDVQSPWIDRASLVLARLEWEVASRVSLPLGTSVLCVARVGVR